MKVKLVVSLTSVHGSDVVDEVEIPDAEWNALDRDGRDKLMVSYLEDHISNNVDSWWEEIG